MGAGKTTVGRRLARALATPFFDSDAEIEKAAAMPIREIFERHGEPYFRDGERRVIRRIAGLGPCVLATGGGAFMDGDTRALLLDLCRVIWLKADVDTLAQRAMKRPGVRPLLADGDPRETLATLLDARRPFYGEAHAVVETGGGSHQASVRAAMAVLVNMAEVAA